MYAETTQNRPGPGKPCFFGKRREEDRIEKKGKNETKRMAEDEKMNVHVIRRRVSLKARARLIMVRSAHHA